MSVETMRLVIDTLHFVVTALLTVYIFVSERRRVTRVALNERLSAITGAIEKTRVEAHERIDDHADRLARAESNIGHLNKEQEEHRDIYERLNALAQTLAGTNSRLSAFDRGMNEIQRQMQRQIEMLNQYLLERGPR